MKKYNTRLFKMLVAVWCTVCWCQCVCATPLRVAGLRCDNLTHPLAIDNTTPRFSWINLSDENGQHQTAYEIQLATSLQLLEKGKADVWCSGKTVSRQQVSVPYQGAELQPRTQYVWRVRTWNKDNECSAWSEPARFGIGILDESTFQGQYITPVDETDQTPLLLKEISLKKAPQQALVYVNSLGYHELYINGTKADSHVLQPAVSQLDRRSHIVTYNVTSLLKKGNNTIVVWLGRGWYKEITYHAQYPTPVVRADIDVCYKGKWNTVAATDESWMSCTTQAGAYRDLGTWNPGNFVGERLDASLLLADFTETSLHKAEWTPVRQVEVKGIKASPQLFPGNRVDATLAPVKKTQLADGRWMLDFGRNITGWLHASFNGLQQGDSIRIDYSDDLDAQGLPESCNEHDVYLACGRQGETFVNRFHHHAFRYAVFSGIQDINAVQSEAIQITADVQDMSSFASSDNELNAIHDMIQRTLRCLSFSGYMVDCPHIERQGYGGDGNSSTLSLQTMQEALPTYRNWVQAWADVQDKDGSLPHVAPTCRSDGGGPYWCGFIIQAPWRAWINYGDDRMLTNYYDNMKLWLDYVTKYSPDGLLTRWPDVYNRGWYLGDWLAPEEVDVSDERSITFVNNCFVVECLDVMAQIAQHQQRAEDSQHFTSWASQLRQRLQHTFYNAADTTYASGSALDMAYAMNIGLMPKDMRPAVRHKTIQLCRTRDNSHIGVGLVGVHVFTEWAIREGESELMYDILKQPDYPGYLHMINNGATTTWESWDRSRSRIHNCYNGIGIWFYQALGGIRHTDNPHHYIVSPQFPYSQKLEWVDVYQQTPYGQLAVKWNHKGETTEVTITVPVGLEVEFIALDGKAELLPSGTTTRTFYSNIISLPKNN